MGACSPGGGGAGTGSKSPSLGSKRTSGNGAKCGKDKGQILSILLAIREPIAEYQQKGGLGRYEQVGFLCLLTSIYQQAYQACLAFLTMLCNLLPFIDVFLLVIRFALDRLICIVKTDSVGAAAVGLISLIGQVFVVIMMLGLICMFLLFPVLSLVLAFVYRLLGMN
ncbi:uncharacterized protein LOC108741250 [Agrilus planipennis]|uniref:Uncharacterized protein LOC108741250 n=1 Tax=Agrilus planipennis TaxID=224129 RepID=A0A1W4X5V4_AGRPL|nr:uncharacterized protein LOC108741250 [Agrilus planipennis]